MSSSPSNGLGGKWNRRPRLNEQIFRSFFFLIFLSLFFFTTKTKAPAIYHRSTFSCRRLTFLFNSTLIWSAAVFLPLLCSLRPHRRFLVTPPNSPLNLIIWTGVQKSQIFSLFSLSLALCSPSPLAALLRQRAVSLLSPNLAVPLGESENAAPSMSLPHYSKSY